MPQRNGLTKYTLRNDKNFVSLPTKILFMIDMKNEFYAPDYLCYRTRYKIGDQGVNQEDYTRGYLFQEDLRPLINYVFYDNNKLVIYHKMYKLYSIKYTINNATFIHFVDDDKLVKYIMGIPDAKAMGIEFDSSREINHDNPQRGDRRTFSDIIEKVMYKIELSKPFYNNLHFLSELTIVIEANKWKGFRSKYMTMCGLINMAQRRVTILR